MKILLSSPRGFCAGVERAINIVNHALMIYGPPIYVRDQIVHNYYVVEDFRKRGVIFIQKIIEVPDSAILIFSAHGVSQEIRQEAKQRNLTVFDATCPLVSKVHMEVACASRTGKEVILIGHSGHPEVESTIGQYNNSKGGIYLVGSVEDIWDLEVKNENNLCFMTQTTLSVEDTAHLIKILYMRFPNILGPRKDDICYATVNRQQASKRLVDEADILLVVGSKNSSNSNRLVEVATKAGKPGYLIDSADDIQSRYLENVKIIGITAGASSPDILVFQVIEYLKKLGISEVFELPGYKENVTFKVPRELRIRNKEIG